ncbi:MAG: DUF2934 domain-containing protein [Opitutus sp.]
MNDESSSISTARPSHDEICQRAQQLWETLGRPDGRDEEIWLQAERELQPAPATTTSSLPVLEELPPISPPSPMAPAKTSAVPRKPSTRSSKAAAR